MSCSTKSMNLNLLNLKRSPYFDDLREQCTPSIVRKATRSTCGLPLWSKRPLDLKIPILPGDPNICALSRRKLGEKLRIDECVDVKGQDFNTSDPYNYYLKLEYEGMHDVHLKRFFRDSAGVRDHLVKMDFVTPKFDVKCNLKEYNAYRNYLRMVHGKAIRKELQLKDQLNRERMMLDVTEDVAQRKIEILKKLELQQQLLKELEQKARERVHEILEKQKQDDERVEELHQIKDDEVRKKKIEAKIEREKYEHKLALMAKEDHKKILNTLKAWHERDRRLRKSLEFIEQNREITRKENALRRFEEKKKSQEIALERDAVVKECAEKIKQSFIENYQEKVERDRRKLKEIFKKKREALEKSLKKSRTKKKKSKKTFVCHCKKQ